MSELTKNGSLAGLSSTTYNDIMPQEMPRNNDNGPSEFLDSVALAALLNTTPNTVRQWRFHGTGPRGARVGKRVLYRRADVDAWLAERSRLDQAQREAIARNRVRATNHGTTSVDAPSHPRGRPRKQSTTATAK